MPAGRSSGRKFSSQLRPLSLSLRLRKATSTLRPERTPSLRDKRIPASPNCDIFLREVRPREILAGFNSRPEEVERGRIRLFGVPAKEDC